MALHTLKHPARLLAQQRAPAPALARHIRIRASSDPDHVLERKDRPAHTLDPQAQAAQGSARAPHEETPAQVHARANGGRGGWGGAEGEAEEARATGLYERLKQMVGLGARGGGTNRQG